METWRFQVSKKLKATPIIVKSASIVKERV